MPTKSTICRRTACLILLLVFFAPAIGARTQVSSSAASSAAASPLDATSFAAELRRLQSASAQNSSTPGEITRLRTSLPDEWNVKTTDGNYEISTAPLAALLKKAEQDPAHSAAHLQDASEWLDAEARQVESYTAANSNSGANAGAALSEILARREFRGVGTASAREMFQQRLQEWLERIVEWFIGHIGRHATSAKIFFELLLVVVVVWLGAALVRFWMRRARYDELDAPQSVAIARSWQEWIRAAREASERGDFREAVHSAYWAGISYLEAVELIEPDRARTPREYVRLLSQPQPETAASLEKPRAALAALTARLEQVWYGRRPASREDFLDSMRQIEGLGCQLP
ncbi:MAG: DUF4129 domain-containing protein [Candidatus Acidiferrales bacterium]